MEPKRITISKNDEATAVAEKLIDAEADTVIFTVPKFSRFSESLANFKLIKREAEVLHKKVIVESIDQAALDFAKRSGLETTNPFFGDSPKKFSDILVSDDVPKRKEGPASAPVKAPRKRAASARGPKKVGSSKPAVAPAPVMIHQEEETPVNDAVPAFIGSDHELAAPTPHVTEVASLSPLAAAEAAKVKQPRPLFNRRNLIVAAALLVVFGLFPYLGLAVLPRADITIQTKKETWSYVNPIAVDKSIAVTDAANARIPGQVFTQKTNANLKFPATGKKQIARKATGTIIIYNGFGSDPQPLVATTRFLTPDGKIFRLAGGITVPGAKVVDGKVTPSNISAAVVADQAGSEYNVGPIPRLTIPGLSGSAKYDTIYGEIKESIQNGFIGEATVATDSDINAAKAAANKSIQDSVHTMLTAKVPPNFKVLPQASTFAITKQVVTPDADADGKFSVFTEAGVSQMAFEEKDLYALLRERIRNEKGSQYKVDAETLNYGAARLDDQTGRMTFAIEYQAMLSQAINVSALTAQIEGQSEAGLRATIASLPGVESAKVDLWPLWVRSVPQNEKKITITAQ